MRQSHLWFHISILSLQKSFIKSNWQYHSLPCHHLSLNPHLLETEWNHPAWDVFCLFFSPEEKKLYLFMPRLTMFQPGAAAGGQAQTCSAATVPLLQAALCPPTHCMTQQFTVHRRRHSPSTGTSWQCALWAPGQLPRWIFIWAWPKSTIHFLSPPII